MLIKTDRLMIRNLETTDGTAFSNMASDGTLNDVGFDTECHSWINEWMREAQQLTDKDDPTVDHLAYTVELKETHEVIGSVGCYVPYVLQRYEQDELIATIRKDNIPL